MIFPAAKVFVKESDEWTRNTNGQEAFHRQIYMISDTGLDIVNGLRMLLLFGKSLERDCEAHEKGVSIDYGTPERWKAVASLTGKCKRKRYPVAAVNDGRASDFKNF
ncbi:hypothetical protein PsorP6_013732 [Peronosclerospora sorghi]|uniref:Uncharacterized protein n=1 Tax=Peronosclerospora sorghi TaxID=230839 RepID=A0ACC0VIZ7_9STRA|nr:hypothetical protein PsorP6_013732 [Peronosclerospora sorghi]